MLLAAALSALHLLGLALAFASIEARRRAFARTDVAAALSADNLWGLSALLLIGTGLLRVFGPFEKGWAFYRDSPAFWLKVGLLGLALLLELWPMATLIGWRVQEARGRPVDPARSPTFARISLVQLLLVSAIPFAAAAMARGIGI